MATVASTSRVWYESSTIVFWSARCAFGVGTNFYVVTQDSGASPRIRVRKAAASSLSFTEQDSANAPTVASDTLPFSAWLVSDRYLLIYRFTGTIAARPVMFDTQTDGRSREWRVCHHGVIAGRSHLPAPRIEGA